MHGVQVHVTITTCTLALARADLVFTGRHRAVITASILHATAAKPRSGQNYSM